jgi:colanic acid biosynthesis glycosyl transferase WcaI
MRLLIVGLNFHPELTGIGKYTGEMAAYLNRQGHQVRVVTTAPYYPYWKTQPGYQWWNYRYEAWSGVDVYRCPLWVPRQPSGLKRLLHLFSFALSSFPILLGQLRWKPDLVLCIAPAFFSAPFAWLAARLSRAKTWLHIQDFELDAATSLGMLRADHLLARWAARGEGWLLARFDRVSTISERMLARLLQKGVNSERTVLFPNWVDTNEIFPLQASPSSLRETLGIPADCTIILYSGNMGKKQGLESLVLAARELQAHSNLRFILCGDGAARPELEMAARDLSNVQFLPLQPPETLNLLLNSTDIHILPQRADAADLVMPSKLLGMLASGKAVIATANPGTEIGNVVGQTGVLGSEGACCCLRKLGHAAYPCGL